MSSRLPPNMDELFIGACLSSEVPEAASKVSTVQQFLTVEQPFSPKVEQKPDTRPRVISPTTTDISWLQNARSKLNKSPPPTSQYRIERPARQDEILPKWLRESKETLRDVKHKLSSRTRTEASHEGIGDVNWLLDAKKSLRSPAMKADIQPVSIELDKTMAEFHLADLGDGLTDSQLDTERRMLENSFAYFYEEEVMLGIADAKGKLGDGAEIGRGETNVSGEGNVEKVKADQQRQRELCEKLRDMKTSVKCDLFGRLEGALDGDKHREKDKAESDQEVTIEDLDNRSGESNGEQDEYIVYERELIKNGPKYAWGDDTSARQDGFQTVNLIMADVDPRRDLLQTGSGILDKQTESITEKSETVPKKKVKEKKKKRKKTKMDMGPRENENQKVKGEVVSQIDNGPDIDQHQNEHDKDGKDGNIDGTKHANSVQIDDHKTAQTNRKKKKMRQRKYQGSNEALTDDDQHAEEKPHRKKKKKKKKEKNITENDDADANTNVKGYVGGADHCEIIQREEPAKRRKKRKRHKVSKLSIGAWSAKSNTVDTHSVNLPTDGKHVIVGEQEPSVQGALDKDDREGRRKGRSKSKLRPNAEASEVERDSVVTGINKAGKSKNKHKERIDKQETKMSPKDESKRYRKRESATNKAKDKASKQLQTKASNEDHGVFQTAWNRIRKLFSTKAKDSLNTDNRKKKATISLFSCLKRQKD